MRLHTGPAPVRLGRAQPRGIARAAAGPGAAPTENISRGVLILPGLGNNAADYGPLAAQLEARGMAVEVAQVTRPDWSRNAAALTDPNWWRGTLKPRPAVDWYLQLVDGAMQRLKRRVEGSEAPITMLTHSAGGWLGRVYLLDWGTAGVDRYVSLGSPHLPPPPGAPVVDQTRGILTACSDMCPGAFHSSIRYVTICGKFVRGVPLTGSSSQTGGDDGGDVGSGGGGGGGGRSDLLAKFAGVGYQQVCGEAAVWGDFIVPQPSAHLEGATQVDLEGVFHSPLGEKLPFFGPWYGSPQVLKQWLPHLTGDQAAEAKVAEVAGQPATVSVQPP
ncbi:hypothetical protein PLESTB_000427400 [Pleodorina starrii]|uniref:GPI inositol-deacylase n=1 Tax=Pleodorina starrii TaxID=330485 RepID=A0A9W6F034_9CHLO|nr:hypothetical protein PLESTM_001696600 [Pleodorina starrii]GLC50746.1 hypothetical protein PLESTB_000427400 [Pleodorina starrii]GLC74348.1 hypothetical protein PLESTF_001502200 [Pleodorina starrii]